MVYFSDWVKYLVEKHYRPCGLDGKLLQYLDELPKYLGRRLGMDESFCKEILDNPDSKIHRLNLIEDALNMPLKKHNIYRRVSMRKSAPTLKNLSKMTGF